MDNILAKILEIGCSGLIGVILTLAVQHWYPAPQEINLTINGEEVTITESDYSSLLAEKENFENELSKVEEELSKTKEELTTTSNELSSKEKELKTASGII